MNDCKCGTCEYMKTWLKEFESELENQMKMGVGSNHLRRVMYLEDRILLYKGLLQQG